MTKVVLLAHNIRSTHNVGSIFRTAECFGVEEIILSGYTPAPAYQNDPRLPHIRDKLESQIHKTALGAEAMVPFRVLDEPPFDSLRLDGYKIVALEQHPNSHDLSDYKPAGKIALLIGEEVNGVSQKMLDTCDDIIEIPIVGEKESLNVSVATGIALYQLTT